MRRHHGGCHRGNGGSSLSPRAYRAKGHHPSTGPAKRSAPPAAGGRQRGVRRTMLSSEQARARRRVVGRFDLHILLVERLQTSEPPSSSLLQLTYPPSLARSCSPHVCGYAARGRARESGRGVIGCARLLLPHLNLLPPSPNLGWTDDKDKEGGMTCCEYSRGHSLRPAKRPTVTPDVALLPGSKKARRTFLSPGPSPQRDPKIFFV